MRFKDFESLRARAACTHPRNNRKVLLENKKAREIYTTIALSSVSILL
jgi:hypothetical protein